MKYGLNKQHVPGVGGMNGVLFGFGFEFDTLLAGATARELGQAK